MEVSTPGNRDPGKVILSAGGQPIPACPEAKRVWEVSGHCSPVENLNCGLRVVAAPSSLNLLSVLPKPVYHFSGRVVVVFQGVQGGR